MDDRHTFQTAQSGQPPGAVGQPGRPAGHIAAWRQDVLAAGVLGLLGTAAAYLNVNIPHTELFIEGRFAFGFIGFALLRRWWLALALALLLCAVGEHKVSLLTAFLANLVYTIPNLIVIRTVHARFLASLRSPVWYGAAWMALVLLSYQVLTQPGIGLVLAVLRDQSPWATISGVMLGQPLLIESILVGIVSTAGMVTLRTVRALAHREHELDVTLDSIGDAVIATDERGRITRMNPMAQMLTGWSLADARGQPVQRVMTLINSETGEPVPDPVARVLLEGRTVGLANDTTLVARGGRETRIADSAAPIRERDGTLLGTIMVFRDVGAAHDAHDALVDSKRQLDFALDTARMGTWDWDVASGRVRLAGWQAALFGFPATTASVPVDAFQERVHPDDWADTWGQATLTAAEGTGFDLTFRVMAADGSERWLRATGKAVPDAAGITRRVIGTAQDITDNRLQQAQLQNTIDALTQSNIELERFAYIASHDLQEPIRNMVAYAQLLSQRYGDRLDDDAETFLGFIVDGAKRMQALVLDLLDYSRVSSAERAHGPVALDEVVSVALDNLRLLMEGSEARIAVGPLPRVQGDPMLLISLMQNLLGNAVKFRRPTVSPEISVVGREEGDAVVVEVCDNGIGIAAEDRDKVFQVFKRLHAAQAYPGTGIGLAVAKRIVERHGGRISVEGRQGPGCCFRVVLPRAAGP